MARRNPRSIRNAKAPPKKPDVEELAISTLSEFTRFVELRCDQELVLFRGQSRDWKLAPKIARVVPARAWHVSLSHVLRVMLVGARAAERPPHALPS